MLDKDNNKDKPVNFYKEKDVLGMNKPSFDKDAENPHKGKSDRVETSEKVENQSKSKNPWVASFLNLMMLGLGHVYIGKVKNGIFFFLGIMLIAISIRFFAFNFYIFVVLITVFVTYYLFVIRDAFLYVKSSPKVPSKSYDKWYVYLLIIVLPNLFFNMAPKDAIDKLTPLNFVTIQTSSMSPALQVGDHVSIERTGDIQPNDVMVFRYPEDTTTLYINRCIGIPGDHLKIKNSIVFINNKPVDNGLKLKFQYQIVTNGDPLDQGLFEEYGIARHNQIDINTYGINITEETANKFLKTSSVINVIRSGESNDNSSRLFPKNAITGWTVDNYGPIYIPKKGEEIKLTKTNIGIYGSLILMENRTSSITDSIVQIDNKIIEDYTFKRNYYFVLGDNRHGSLDSRYWGFVRESYIVGKGLYRYWAKDMGRIGEDI